MEHWSKNYFAYWASNFIINDNLFDDDGNIIMKNNLIIKQLVNLRKFWKNIGKISIQNIKMNYY